MRKLLLVVILLATIISMVPIKNTFATHTATVQWVKEAPADPTYPPHPGAANEYYWNGLTPKWINFTVKNNGPDSIKEIKVVFEKDSNRNSFFNFSETRQKTGWYATPDEFGPNKRPTVLYFRTDDPSYYIKKGETARFDIFFTQGPKEECSYNIDVWTVDAGDLAQTNFYQLFILIDNCKPAIEIITPKNGTIFQYGETVWINATAKDAEGLHPSSIKRVELWFTYTEKTGKSGPIFVGLMKYDDKKKVYWWKTTSDFLKNEAWHKAVAIAYDYAENKKESEPITFFWYKPTPPIEVVTIDKCFLENKPVGHVDSTAKITVHTGFLPNAKVTAKFADVDIGSNITDAYGQFELVFKIPEKPRGTYKVTATDGKATASTEYTIVPWVWAEPAEGNVEDEVTITGKGFAANVEVDVIYRDISQGRYFDKWAVEWGSDGIKLEWKPCLDNVTVTPTTNPPKTDTKGTFTFKFKIPQSFGGYHPIYAEERKTKVRSGWMPDYPQAALFKVKTKIWTEPIIGLTGQFIQIFGDGLPLPIFTERIYDCTTKKTTTQEHDYYLVIDFGPNKYWVFEKGFILNNEFDYAWYLKLYLPFAYHFPKDALQYPDPASPVWNGKLCWRDAEGQYHIGSPFLKVPALVPGDYNITVYEFDAKTHTDVYKYKASTTFKVLKDPLYIRVNTGTLYFSGENVKVYAEIDLDGAAADPTTITFKLYRENTLISTLSPQRIATGLYSASFTCPSEKGNYFIIVNATLNMGGISLSGFGTASFTVSPTLDGFNATLTAINGNIATINTKIGEIKLSLNDLNTTIKSIQNGLVTIQTSLGEVKTYLDRINAQIISLSGDTAVIKTDLGNVKSSLDSINAQIINLSGDTAVIKTDLGIVKSSLESINAQIMAIGQNVVKIETSLGTFEGKISDIQGKTVTIDTRVGTIYATIDSIKTETGLQPTNLALSLIAAIAAIIAAILIFRKAYA